AWDLPAMPWNGTTLYVADVAEDGAVGVPRVVAGGAAESVFQPEWSPSGDALVFVSDRSGWWNPYRYDPASQRTVRVVSRDAEFGQPQWQFAMSTYAFAGADRIVCTYSEDGLSRLAILDLATAALQPIATSFTEFAAVRAEGDRVVLRAGAPALPGCI